MRPRGLCRDCYFDKSIRVVYPKKVTLHSHRSKLAEMVKYGTRKLPDKPTEYLPGTIEKIRVMEERYASGCLLYHPKDAEMDIR